MSGDRLILSRSKLPTTGLGQAVSHQSWISTRCPMWKDGSAVTLSEHRERRRF